MKSRREESQSMPRGREISSSDKALVGSADYGLSVDGLGLTVSGTARASLTISDLKMLSVYSEPQKVGT